MQVDGVAFESPAGLEDSSNYCFKASASLEEISVEFELPIGGGTPAADVIAEAREAMAGYYDSAFQVIAEGETELAGSPARFIHYRLSGEQSLDTKMLVANIGPTAGEAEHGDWVKLVWSGEQQLDAAYLDPIVASFVVADRASAAPPAGHERREAGPWAIDVPAHLQGPRTFIFEDVEAELRVELSVLVDGAAEPSLDAGVASADAEQLRRDEAALDDGARVDMRLRSDSDPNGESTVILAKRQIELAAERKGQTRWVVVSASGPARDETRLTTIVDELLASIHAGGTS